jgi:PAS domain-containing protein
MLFESMDEGYCLVEMIFDAAAQPVDYRFLEVNSAFEKKTGLLNAQGKRIREINLNNEAQWFEIYGRVAVTGEAIRFVKQAKSLNGRWFDIYAFRHGGNESRKVAILFSDISDRKASEDALKASENRSTAILAIHLYEYGGRAILGPHPRQLDRQVRVGRVPRHGRE